MKWILALLITIATAALSLYLLLFTSPGNALVAPFVEQKINSKLPLTSKLETFRLDTDSFEITLLLTPGNRLNAAGTYSLFSQTFRIAYRLRLGNLEALEPLTGTPLYGQLHTDGEALGDPKNIHISGKSNIASSETTYDITLADGAPKTATATIRHAATATLLSMIGKAPYAAASLDLDADIQTFDPKALEGSIAVNLASGHIDTALMRRDFNITLPKTTFTAGADVTLHGGTIRYKTNLTSNLAKVASSGMIAPKPLKADVTYDIDFRELGLLAPLTNAPLRGPLRLEGSVKGDETLLTVIGKSDIAQSKTDFRLRFKAASLQSAEADIRTLRLDRLLYLAGQPAYLRKGTLDANIRIPDATRGALAGTVTTTIRQAAVDGKTAAREFGFKRQPQITFASQSRSVLKGSRIDTRVTLDSNIMKLDIADAEYDLKQRKLTSDYKVTIPDLDTLYFATERHLRGNITVNGRVEKGAHLRVNAASDTLGGHIDAVLDDEKLQADLVGLNTRKVLHMLIYPEVFDAAMDGKLTYNTGSKRGEMTAHLIHGYFTKNSAFDLLRQYSTVDLYKERFKGDALARIDDKRIDADMTIRSNRSSLKTKHAKIDTAANTINANIHLNANNNPVDFRLKGNLNHPNVSIDAGKLIEREAGKQINRLLNNLFR